MINKQNLHLSLLIIFSAFLVASFITFSSSALAQETTVTSTNESFSYPITELGNCASKTECKSYCDDLANTSVCLDFAERHNLMSEQKISRARNFISANSDTPGNCSSKEECRTYCSDSVNLDECVTFAERHNLMSDQNLGEAKKIRDFIKQGGSLPGNCSTKDECRTYCSDLANLDECVAFTKQAGFATESEVQEMSKVVSLIKSGSTPGSCTSKEECRTYCSDSSNREECAEFGKKIGILDDAKAEVYRRIGSSGPGSCSSREECSAYCSDPDNQSRCLVFAEQNGVINSDELANIRDIATRFKNLTDNAPVPVAECIQGVVGENVLAKIKSGEFIPSSDLADKIKTCVRDNINEATKLRVEQRIKANTNSDVSQNEIQSRLRIETNNGQSIEIRNEARERLKESLESDTVDPNNIKDLENRFFEESKTNSLNKVDRKENIESKSTLENKIKSSVIPSINIEKQKLELENKLRSSNANTGNTVSSTR